MKVWLSYDGMYTVHLDDPEWCAKYQTWTSKIEVEVCAYGLRKVGFELPNKLECFEFTLSGKVPRLLVTWTPLEEEIADWMLR